MKKALFWLFYSSFSFSATAHTLSLPDITYLQSNPKVIEKLLSENMYSLSGKELARLIDLYQYNPHFNKHLAQFAQGRIAFLEQDYYEAIRLYRQVLSENPELNPVRIELAIALFHQRQDSAARTQFEKAKVEKDLPDGSLLVINNYLQALDERQGWEIDFTAHYIRDKNVNHVANVNYVPLSNRAVLTKSQRMLPQSAHGLGYFFSFSRDFNLFDSHYFLFGNRTWGKEYWDNHEYDDILNRTFLGYAYKNASHIIKVKPFYERRWYGNHRYRWNNGVQVEYDFHFNPHWQLAYSAEFEKQHYFIEKELNGHLTQLTPTLIFQPNTRQFFYIGGDWINEKTQVRQYGSKSKGLRLGWGQDWGKGISSQIAVSFIKRNYKDVAKLGNLDIFSFNKNRKDHIYSLNLLVWKRDWHLGGITPKLQFTWKKQISNIPQMYSYQQKNINLIFEKSF